MNNKEIKYLIGMIKAGKYCDYIEFHIANNMNTIQIPTKDFELIIQAIIDGKFD